MRVAESLALILVVGSFVGFAQEPATPLSLNEVVSLVQSGLSEELVIARIKGANRRFDLNADEMLELKKAGVSDNMIRYLVDPSAPYSPPGPPAAALRDVNAPPLKDPLMPKIPPEPGMYWLSSAQAGKEMFEYIELKPIVPLKAQGKLSGKLGALRKKRAIGFFVSPSAALRMALGANVFYGRLGPKAAIEDIVLLRLEKEDSRRTLDFGPRPDKPVFPPDAVRPFESKLLADGLYRLDVAPLMPGEYVFLILGSGDEKKGVLGKGYDLGVNAPF